MSKSDNLAYRAIDAGLRTTLRRVPATPLAESIALYWGYRYQPKPRAVRLRSGVMLQTTHVDHLQLLLYYLGTFEPKALEAMRRHLKSGATLLDVGANIGLFTVEGAQAVGPAGSVISIEAAPHHAKAVVEACRLNQFSNVEVHAMAAGDCDGDATLTLPRHTNFGMFTLGEVDGDESFSVPVRRIDDIVAGRKVDFIKMDIEGSEYRALSGADRTLSRFKPAILIELNEAALKACGSTSRQVKEFLFARGYKGRTIANMSPITLEQSHVCDECLFTN